MNKHLIKLAIDCLNKHAEGDFVSKATAKDIAVGLQQLIEENNGLNINQKLIIDGILTEVERATKKHPTWPKDKVYAATIVAEENGELTRACLQYESEGGTIDEVKTEAIHVAATAFRLLYNL